jgi:FMN reductase
MSILLVAGSPSERSRSAALLDAVSQRLRGHGLVERLQIRDLSPQALLLGDGTHRSIANAVDQLARARALVIATPVYKAAYSGLLKAVLDLLPQDGLAGKLVLPLATGGSQSHMLALDYALRPVLASMAPRSILPSIYATSDQLGRHADGSLALAPGIAARVALGVEQLAAELGAAQPALAA